MRGTIQVKGFIIVFSVLAMVFAGCTRTVDDSKSLTMVTITNMQALPASQAGTAVDNLNSDVCANAGATWPPGCTAIEDYGEVTMSAQSKTLVSAGGAFLYNNLVFDRYRVTFIRADGRNTPGIDVPYPFDGMMTFHVPADTNEYTKIFVVVRHQTKLEPPIANLAGNGGAIIISAMAQVDFYGKDLAGNTVTARGFLTVSFGDF